MGIIVKSSKKWGAIMSIIMENVTKKFGKFAALDGLNLELKEGEIMGFIGPNGAGKTTAIRVLLGLLKANEGKSEIFGMDAWKDSVEIHKRLAYVPGDVNLWPNLTGGEVIDLFTRLRGGKDNYRKNELIEKFDFDPTKKCRTYSKGNRQKVALISAFTSDADLYIFDEPTSGLDPLMERMFQDTIREAKEEGKSILLSSHILSEVEKVCDKVSIIRNGKIIDSGTLHELRHLTRTEIEAVTRNRVEGLEENSHIYNLEQDGNRVSFSVDGEAIGTAITHLSQYGIMELESMPPTLEQLFMSHYSERGKE